jgi:hypothetical protein
VVLVTVDIMFVCVRFWAYSHAMCNVCDGVM